MLSTFEAENRHLYKHAQPELKKRSAYKKKMCSFYLYINTLNHLFLLPYDDFFLRLWRTENAVKNAGDRFRLGQTDLVKRGKSAGTRCQK